VRVSEVFEVMMHVYHVLTLVNKFDRQLRLIKNLGHHNLAPLSGISPRDSIHEKQGR
jgi:hypothetical protein